MLKFRRTTLAFAVCLTTAAAFAQAPLKILSSNGVKAVMEEIKPQIERAAGRPVDIQFSATSALRKQIEGGEAFDLTILTPEAITDLTKKGKIAPNTRAGMARSGVGIGNKAGAPKPDVSTPDALKRTLLSAKSVTMTQGGASQQFIEGAFEKLGIAAQMKPKVLLDPVPGHAAPNVADGKAEYVMTLASEILPVKGVQYIGPLPGALQNYVSFTAAIGTGSKNAAAAKSVIQLLSGSQLASVLKAKGMEAYHE